MIQYSLICENAHKFDAWFKSAAAYDEQHERGIVTCPVCMSAAVDKAIMAPAVNRTDGERVALSAGHPQAAEVREMMRALHRKVTSEADYVGDKFADEARKIHYGETEERGIYGNASHDEAKSLIEEGIAVHPLPRLPEDGN